MIETKFGWLYNIVRRAFGAATSLVFSWVTKDKTPLLLGGNEEHAATAPPVADASYTAADAKSK